MADLTVLIPSRREEWLNRTVADVLAHSNPDRTRILVVLDGDWPDEPLPQDPRVDVLYHPESRGQRAACNEAARIATTPYVMKLDAHCSMQPGFDLALLNAAAVLPRETIQVPAQKNLHVFDWVCTACQWRDYMGPVLTECPHCKAKGTLTRDIIWKPRKGTTTTAWAFDKTLHFHYYDNGRQKPQQEGDFPQVMSMLGACWFLDRRWFLDELEGLDEAHGSWGQMGTELACKAWLSGGQVVCNRTTKFAHLFRTRGGFGFPYEISGTDQEAARVYSRKLWRGNGWHRQIHPLRWLVEKFAPYDPRDWTSEDIDQLPKTLRDITPGPVVSVTIPMERNDMVDVGHAVERLAQEIDAKALKSAYESMNRMTLDVITHDARPVGPSQGVIYYSDGLDSPVTRTVRQVLTRSAGGRPIVAVSLPSINTDDAFTGLPSDAQCVLLPKARGYLTMFEQILTALRLLDTDYVFFCEHDVLYPAQHFDECPMALGGYLYNTHVWKVDATDGKALSYIVEQTSGLSGNRRALIEHYTRRVAHVRAHGFSRQMGFEPGKPVRHGGIDDVPRFAWQSSVPLVDVRHGSNLTPSRWRKDQFRSQRYTEGWTEGIGVPGWDMTVGRFDAFLADVAAGRIPK